jgi:hypothetical protein
MEGELSLSVDLGPSGLWWTDTGHQLPDSSRCIVHVHHDARPERYTRKQDGARGTY